MRTRIFKDQDNFSELIIRLEYGQSYLGIAKRFRCDHTTIMYHARKLGLAESHMPLICSKTIVKDPDPLNKGHSYRDYLRIERERVEAAKLRTKLPW